MRSSQDARCCKSPSSLMRLVTMSSIGWRGGIPPAREVSAEEKTPRPSRPDMDAAIDAARRGDVEFLREWVARGATLEDKLDNSYVSLTLLQLASCEGDEVAAHTVLRAGADANHTEPHEGYSALMIAARYDHVGVMRLLLGSGANINLVDSLGHNALHYAATSGQLRAAKLLLAAPERPALLG